MSLIKKLAGETMLYGLSSILGRLLNYFILASYLTRVFTGEDTEQYGIHTVMYSFAALAMVFFTYRMETTFFRFGSRAEDRERTFTTASISLLASTLVLVGLIWFLAEPIAARLSHPGDGRYVRYFAFILALDTLAVIPFAQLRLDQRPLRFALFKILNILVNIGVLIFFLELCPRLLAAGYDTVGGFYNPRWNLDYVFLANLVASAVSFLLFLPRYAHTRWQFDPVLWRRMLAYAGPLILVGVAGVIVQTLDRYLLLELLPGTDAEKLQQVGIYGACLKIAVLMNLFIQAFNYAAEPFFFNNAKRTDSAEVYGQVAQAFTLVGSLVFLGLVLYLDLVQYLIGADYRSGLAVVPILLLAYFFLGLYYNFSIWYKLTDRTDIGAYISTAGALISVGLNLYLIPRIGYLGSSWAALAAYFFMALCNYAASRRYYPVNYPVGKMAFYLLLAIGAYGLSEQLRPLVIESLGKTLALNTLILLLYLGLIAWVERALIRRFLQSRT
ncbi:MAG: polysaccharide biosynthesis C-terminal domain-containing protein [Bacteroidota bacterium]